MAKKILIVEDEHNIAELIAFNLRKNGYEYVCTDSGENALKILEREHFDLILLDLMLTGMDGMDFCRIYRADAAMKQVPIIMLTARGEESDIVSGLEYGADDYMTKPFSPRVLIARIKARLREPDSSENETISRNGITLRPQYHEAELDGKPLQLTANEFALLKMFLTSTGRVFTRDEIINYVHGVGYAVTDRAIDVQIVGLRKKLGDKAQLIETIRGVGYRWSRTAQ